MALIIAKVLQIGIGNYTSDGTLIPLDVAIGDTICFVKAAPFVPVEYSYVAQMEHDGVQGPIPPTAGLIDHEYVIATIADD